MINLQDFKRLEYSCGCGKTHYGYTEYCEVGRDAIMSLGSVAKKILTDGTVGVCYYEDTAEIANTAVKILQANGYAVEKICFASNTPANLDNTQDLINSKENIRLFVGVGGGSLCDMLKYAGEKRKNGVIYIMTAPSTDSYLADNVMFMSKGKFKNFFCAPPLAIICDYNIIAHAPKQLCAGGYGEIVSKMLDIFEDTFNEIITNSRSCNTPKKMRDEVLINFFKSYDQVEYKEEYIADTLIRLGLISQTDSKNYVYTHSIVATLLENEKMEAMPLGINKMLASVALSSSYSSILHQSAYSLKFAPLVTDECYKLGKTCGFDYISLINELEINKNIFSQMFIYDEYRGDLLTIMDNVKCKIAGMCKHFRRLFDDAGWRISEYVDSDTLFELISSVGALCEKNSLLSLATKCGLAPRQIEAV